MTAKNDETDETKPPEDKEDTKPTKTEPKAEKEELRAPELDTQDKNGTTLVPGDTVSFVYGGDHHVGQVETITEELGSVLVHVKATARVPGAACLKVTPKTHQPVNERRRSAE